MDRATKLRRRSEASKKAWAARKRRMPPKEAAHDRGGVPAPARKDGPRIGADAIMRASTPERSSTDVANLLGLHPAYVRKVWALKGRPRQPSGVHPRVRLAANAHE